MGRLRRIAVWLWRLLAQVGMADLLLIAGGACVVYGVALIYPPGGWIAAGAGLLVAGIFLVTSERKRGPS